MLLYSDGNIMQRNANLTGPIMEAHQLAIFSIMEMMVDQMPDLDEHARDAQLMNMSTQLYSHMLLGFMSDRLDLRAERQAANDDGAPSVH